MGKDILSWKGLAVASILLFIGLSVAPSINANVSKDSEMVEYTTDLCGLGGGKRTIEFTQEEADDLELLLENIQIQLNNAKSITEAKEIEG